jgi:hypothetical protein
MMDPLATLSVAAGLAWASGVRLYLALFVVGLLGRLGYLTLPPGLSLLSHDWVLAASGIMLVAEFLADKIPAFDSLWDAVHTFIRIPAGAVLAGAAVGVDNAALTLAAAIAGGTIATGSHLAKSGTRALINTSPEPFTNWTASFSEDGLVLAGLWAAFSHPLLFLALLLVFLVFAAWLVPKLWRTLRALFARLAAGARAQ